MNRIFLVVLMATLLAANANAAPGDLDTTFGGGAGWVNTKIGLPTSSDIAYSAIQQADGKLVAAGISYNGSNYDFALVRHNSDGSLDTTFNGTGKLTTAIGISNDFANSVIQQTDGKLVVAGYSLTGSLGFTLVRYNSDGSLDTTFNGTGRLSTIIGADDVASSVIQQADGKLVVAGHSHNGIDVDFALVRYNSNGALDPTFNGTGKLTTDMGASNDYVNSVIQQANGKLVVAGYSTGSNAGFALARYNSDGSLDTTFNGTGKLITVIGAVDELAYSVIQQADGKLVVAGSSRVGSSYKFALVRYNSNGSLDTTFNGTGKLTTAVGAADDYGMSVIQQGDGKLVAAGRSYSGSKYYAALVRYNSDGSLDTTFNGTGKLTKAFSDIANAVVQQADGKLVMAGYSSTLTGQDFMLARFASGQPDADVDGTIDGLDADDDNDGVLDVSDAFPFDPTETADTDGDNIGDNVDLLPNDASTLNNYPGKLASDKSGSSVAFAGDFDGDGYGDYVIGMPGFDVSSKAKDAGRAEVISGKSGAVITSINGAIAKDASGTAVTGAGDINNDGFDDVVIGAPNAGITHAGSITILYGPDGAIPQILNGTVAKSGFGSAVALGDVNGDNRADILVGAPKDDDVEKKLLDAGSVTVYSGSGFAALNTYYGVAAKASAGASVAAGDTNKDGNADIIIGAPNDGGTGSVTVYNLAGTILLQKSGETAKAQFGKSVASGDINGDGFADVLVGAPVDDDISNKLKDSGSITAYSGNSGVFLAKKYGAVAKAGFGNSVAAGDVNGDSYADLIACAWKNDKAALPKPIKDTGSVSVFSGNGYAPIGSTMYGGVSKDYFGNAVSAGDINSDGKSDLIIGIPGFDLPAAKPVKDVGAVKVLSGGGL